MSISAQQYDGIIEKWAKSPQGKAHILQKTGTDTFDAADMKKIAFELRNAIVRAYLDEIKNQEAKYFDMDTVDVIVKPNDKKNRGHLQIVFRGEGLARTSLFAINQGSSSGERYSGKYGKGKYEEEGYFTGRGVYDVIGLFTQGYDTDTKVYGNWIDPRTGIESDWTTGRIKNLQHRQGSDFVNRVVADFKKRYPFLEITYPELWGGTRKPVGNWKRGAKK